MIEKIKSLVEAQNTWRKYECINLIASENVTSPLVDSLYSSDFSHRYAEGDPYKRFYNGTKYIDEIESAAIDMAKRVFRAKTVSLQLISGTVANIAAISMFTQPGDIIITNATASGGHISHNKSGAAGLLGLDIINFPVTEDGFHIDVDKTLAMIKKSYGTRKRLTTVLFGCSLFLFPQPVKEISEASKEYNIKIIYDAAHVLGLVAGSMFQDPLNEGADIVTASTHKTFFGPQGGVIFTNMEQASWDRYKSAVFPGVTSNHHLHRLPALAAAFMEHLEFGREYAEQVVANAKALGEALYNKGFDVKCPDFGFTQSHQVAVDVSKLGGGRAAADKLESSNIIVNKNLLPGEIISKDTLGNPSGIRIGVQEMTRWGMKQSDMESVAELFRRVLFEGKNEKENTLMLRKQFQTVRYTFNQ